MFGGTFFAQTTTPVIFTRLPSGRVRSMLSKVPGGETTALLMHIPCRDMSSVKEILLAASTPNFRVSPLRCLFKSLLSGMVPPRERK